MGTLCDVLIPVIGEENVGKVLAYLHNHQEISSLEDVKSLSQRDLGIILDDLRDKIQRKEADGILVRWVSKIQNAFLPFLRGTVYVCCFFPCLCNFLGSLFISAYCSNGITL